MGNATLAIGIGNRYRGDDALGCLVVDKLRKRSWKGVDVIEHDGEPASLIELWQGYSSVIIVDAVVSGAKSGTIHRIDLHKQYLPTNFGAYSSHGIGVTEAIELARVIQKLPPRIVFLGIEGASFSMNTQSNRYDRLIIEKITNQIMEEIG
ncbi:MAG: hydrogenase maturation protease [Bacteroidota bacterium]